MWNYRVIRKVEGKGPTHYYYSFGIYEVYYDEDGKVRRWVGVPISASGGTPAELMAELAYMQKALERPALDYKTGKEIKP